MSRIQANWLYTIRWRLMLIVVASLAMTSTLIILGYLLAEDLQRTKFAADIINWVIEHVGSIRVMFIAAIILFPITFFLASLRLVKDLREINSVIQEISAGQFGRVVTVKGKDELSAIAESINQLSSEWDHYLEEITRGLDEISNGKLDHQIPEIVGNQLSEVALSINKMSMQLKHSIAEERKAEKTKNDLITGVSHDLRTPLTSILGFLEVIENDRYQDEVEMRYYINIAYEKSLNLRRLIDELFEYTRINNGMPLELSELDIDGLIRQLEEEFVPVTDNAGMVIRLNIQEGEFKIQADGGLLVRAYENLITNAIKYGQAGKYIDIDVARDGDVLVVRIHNYGEPIPERNLPFIFERFYRVEASRSKQTGGTGLGLAIAKSIVEVHGGCITVHSNEKVTSFETRFPSSGLNKADAAVREEVQHEIERLTTSLPEHSPAPKQKITPRWRRLFEFESRIAAVSMIVLLVCTVLLFSVKNPFTSALMVMLDSIFLENNDSVLMPTSGDNLMVITTGKTDKGYTLIIHDYVFNGHKLDISYSIRPSSEKTLWQWGNQSVKPNFELDNSTKQAVPGIDTNNNIIPGKYGTINYYFTGDPPPDKFMLNVNVKDIVLLDDQDQQHILAGDWSFEILIEKNYRLKSNGQSELIKDFY